MSTATDETIPAEDQGTRHDHPPLTWRVEARRQLTRRRTLFSGIFVLALPIIVVIAFALGGPEGSGPRFVSLAQHGAANFVIFVLFVSADLLLMILAALFCGDTVPAEASWSSLRYLLTGPVPRARLLTSKAMVGVATTIAAVIVLLGWSLLVGGVRYGWSGFQNIDGSELGWSGFLVRLLLIACYLVITLLQVGAIALWIGVRTDAPLAAVGGTVMTVIVAAVLEQIDALGDLRHALPMHFSDAWQDLLATTPQTTDLLHGVLWSLLYTLVFGALAYHRFLRADILS